MTTENRRAEKGLRDKNNEKLQLITTYRCPTNLDAFSGFSRPSAIILLQIVGNNFSFLMILHGNCSLNTSSVHYHYDVIVVSHNAYVKHCRPSLIGRQQWCLSFCQTRRFRQYERNLCPHSFITWKIIHSSFVTRRIGGGGRPILPEISLERKHWLKSIDIRS